MFPKFSVKKPYTVMVGIVLVIILGIVSFTSMTTDLLPNINLPYAVVMTTYIGASPEEVETVVTKPVEQAMATVSNIQNIQSVSSENVSMVILEFSQTTNMDSVSLEMRENLDQIKSYWDDTVGNPIIMKLNPDMLPVMVAAVEQDGMSSIEITDFVDENILSELESLEGVASISTSGSVDETVHLILSQEKIDALNQKIADTLGITFKDAKQELEDAKAELDKAQDEIDKGIEELENGQQQMTGQLSDAKNELTTQQLELVKTEMDLKNKLAQLEAAETELLTTEAQLLQVQQLRDQLISRLQNELLLQKIEIEETIEDIHEYKTLQVQVPEAEANMNALKIQLSVAETELASLQALLTTAQRELADLQAQVTPEGVASDEVNAAITAKNAEIELLNGQISEKTAAVAELNTKVTEATNKYNQLKAQLEEQERILTVSGVTNLTEDGLEASLTMLNGNLELVNNAIKEVEEALAALPEESMIDTSLAEIAAGKVQIKDGKVQINNALTQISAGLVTIEEAAKMLSEQEINATIEMASAKAQILAGQAQIDQGKAQVDAGLEQLEQAEKDALEGANLNKMLTADMLKQVLTAQNFSMPAGYVTEEGIQYLIRVGNKLADTEDLANLVLFDMGLDGIDPIKVSDVGDVAVVNNAAEVYARINGNPGIVLSIQKQTGYSTGDVSDKLKERFEELEEQYPGLSFTELMDQGIYIDFIVDSVLSNLLSGAVLAILILFLFLKDIRPTAVVALSIPVSVLTAIVLMYFSGITLNIISLSGLALGVGMLVDNSIVVIENIYRLRNLGVSTRKAAVQGARQVSGAIVASTLTTVCVFLPIVFTEGITKQLFVDMGLTIGYSLLASLIVALTVVPAMSVGLIRKNKQIRQPLLDRVGKLYEKSMGFVLKCKAPVLILAIVLLVLSVFGALKKGTAFMPAMESTQATITVTAPEGSSMEDLATLADEVMTRIEDISDIEEMGAMAGGSGIASMMGMGGGGSSTTASIYLILSEQKELTGAELGKEIEKRVEGLDGEISISTNTMDMSALGGSGIGIQIKGKELDTLQSITKDIAGLLESVEGLESISDGLEESTEELRIVVDKEKAAAHNLTVAQVYLDVVGKLSESGTATTLSTESKDYDVIIVEAVEKKYTREDVKDFTIEVTDKEGKKEEIPLSDIVSFETAYSPDSINRVNQSRYLSVSAAVADGYNVGILGAEVEELLEDYELPMGYSLEFTGEDETINEAMVEMMKMLGLAVVFIYLVMVAQFQSLLSPFIVMFTIPLAFTGGFMGLLVADQEVSIIAMVGFVMLSGIIVNNGIVLVDYINQLRIAGMEKRQAIITAGKTRLRPILMTALTTILGLSTMALGAGMGADMVQPMAVVTIGGLLYGTLLTLYIVPCIYDILNRKKDMTTNDAELDDVDYIAETIEHV